MADGQVAMAEGFNPKLFWEDIRKYGCTETVSMGGAFSLVEKNPPSAEDRDHPLKKIYIIPLPVDFQQRCEKRFGIKMMEIYGQTECNLVCFRTWDRGKVGSCGFANSGFEIKIFDEKDNECAPNVEGEIVVRPTKSHIIAKGYYKMPEKFGERMTNCWWHTGDLGRMDEDGYLYFHRRKEETIRFRGHFVSTTEVEAILNKHPDVLECAVFGVPDQLGQEQDVMAAVRLKPQANISPDALLRHCEVDLPFYMIPCYVRFVDEFEKTPTLRIIKDKLQKEGISADTWCRRECNFKLSRE
jgi:crotonobetaine/carnitine-CoA ligase